MSEEFVPHADWPFPKPEQLENKILRDSVIELRAALADLEQEPVGWVSTQTLARLADFDGIIYATGGFDDAVALYAHPPQRKPLTNDAYRQLMKHAHRLAMDGHGELAQYLRDAIDQATAHKRCSKCGLRDVSLTVTCHNSRCNEYAKERIFYEG